MTPIALPEPVEDAPQATDPQSPFGRNPGRDGLLSGLEGGEQSTEQSVRVDRAGGVTVDVPSETKFPNPFFGFGRNGRCLMN
jgi:hypothetical protein